MGFFEKGQFDEEKKKIEERGPKKDKFAFEWEGSFIATIDSAELGKCEKPGKHLGAPTIMIRCTILEVIESEDPKLKAGTERLIYWRQQGYFGEKLLQFLPALFGCEVSEVTEDMANDFVDPENHTFDGIPCFFSRIRETYTNSKGEEKSYVPDGLDRPLTKKEVKDKKFDIPKNILELLD